MYYNSLRLSPGGHVIILTAPAPIRVRVAVDLLHLRCGHR